MNPTYDNDAAFNQLQELAHADAHITVRLEIRRFRKPVTIIQGLPATRLTETAKELKRKFGTGGTTKGGELLLQGDHRSHVRDELVRLGYPADHIDIV